LSSVFGGPAPVDAKRHSELAELFAGSSAGLVFVSCFPDRREMRKYLADIAWETEVWCADNPTHLIYFNGERSSGHMGLLLTGQARLVEIREGDGRGYVRS
jgi:type II restriction enzyme